MEVILNSQIRINTEEKIEREFTIQNTLKTKPLWVKVGTNMPVLVESELISGLFKPGERLTAKAHCQIREHMSEAPILKIYFKNREQDTFKDYVELKLLSASDLSQIKTHLTQETISPDLKMSGFLRSGRDILVSRNGKHVKHFTKQWMVPREDSGHKAQIGRTDGGEELSAIFQQTGTFWNSKMLQTDRDIQIHLEEVLTASGEEGAHGESRLKLVPNDSSGKVTIVKEQKDGELIVEMEEEKDQSMRRNLRFRKRKNGKKKAKRKIKSAKKSVHKTKEKKKRRKKTKTPSKLKTKRPQPKGNLQKLKSKYDRLQRAYGKGIVDEWADKELRVMGKVLRRARTNQEILNERADIFRTYRKTPTRRFRSKRKKSKAELVERVYDKRNLKALYAYTIRTQRLEMAGKFTCFGCFRAKGSRAESRSEKVSYCVTCTSANEAEVTNLASAASSKQLQRFLRFEKPLTVLNSDLNTNDYNLTMTEHNWPSEGSKNPQAKNFKEKRPSGFKLQSKRNENFEDRFRTRSAQPNKEKILLEKIREQSSSRHESSAKRTFRSGEGLWRAKDRFEDQPVLSEFGNAMKMLSEFHTSANGGRGPESRIFGKSFSDSSIESEAGGKTKETRQDEAG